MKKKYKLTEKRKTERIVSSDIPAFIEVNHSYGRIKKSVYRVYEHTESGLSFLIPFEEGYFITGTPLKFFLIKNHSRSGMTGIVRYYQPFYTENGEKFYRIGMETHLTFRDQAAQKYQLRPFRFPGSGARHKNLIIFEFQKKIHRYPLVDFSKYSAAFFCDLKELSFIPVSTVISPVQIIVSGNVIFDGSATVVKIYHDQKDRKKMVLEPRDKLINVDFLEDREVISSASENSAALITAHSGYEKIDPAFRVAVSDLRCFLDDYKKFLESPVIVNRQNESGGNDDLLMEIFPKFFIKMDSLITGIDRIVAGLKLSEKQHEIYKSYYQKNLLSYILLAPINHRAYFKPEGYPGDYEIMKMNCENRFEGRTLMSRIIHKYTTATAIGETGRERTKYIAERILDFARKSPKPQVEILSAASGPALEIDHLIRYHAPETKKISVTLLDQEVKALSFSQNNLYENRIRYGSDMRIQFIHQKLEDYLLHRRENLKFKYDMIYSFGLFDYFDQDLAKFIIQALIPQVESNGKLLIANISLDSYQYRTFLEYGLDWYVVYRTRKQLNSLCSGIMKGRRHTVDEIQGGMMKILEIF